MVPPAISHKEVGEVWTLKMVYAVFVCKGCKETRPGGCGVMCK